MNTDRRKAQNRRYKQELKQRLINEGKLDEYRNKKSRYDKQHYKLNNQHIKQRVHMNLSRRKKNKKNNLQKVNEYKLQGCNFCGYNKCPVALDFHHPGKKE